MLSAPLSRSPRVLFSALAALTVGALLTLGFSAGAAQAVTTDPSIGLTVQDDLHNVVSGAVVSIYEDDGFGGWAQAGETTTTDTGLATFEGLDSNTKFQVFVDMSGDAPTADASGWVTTGGATVADWEHATGVTTTTGALSLTATLSVGNTVSGTAFNSAADLTPISSSSASVQAFQRVTDIESGNSTLQYDGQANVQGDSTYSFPGLSNGDYFFKLIDYNAPGDGHPSATWNAGDTLASGTTSGLTAESVTGNVTQDVALAVGTVITGTVSTDPLLIAGGGEFIDVTAYPTVNGTTDADSDYTATINGTSGTYSIVVPAGAYKVQFSPNGAGTPNVFSEWYDNAPTSALAATVETSTVGPVEADATLGNGFTISGTVKAGGQPLAGVQVFAASTENAGNSGPVMTDASGNYSLTNVAPATYTLEFDGTTAGYGDVFYDGTAAGSTNFNNAVAIGGVDGTVTRDLTYSPTSTLTVHLANKAGTALSTLDVQAIPIKNGIPDFTGDIQSGKAVHGKAGTYTVAGLSQGQKYTLSISPATSVSSSYYPQYLGGSPSDYGYNLPVENGSDVQTFIPTASTLSVDGTVQSSPVISGTVESSSGAKLANVGVELYRYDGSSWTVYDQSGTSSKGVYSFGSEPSGSYKIQFISWGSKYVSSWYGGATESAATPFYLSQTSAKVINPKLITGGTITGIVHTDQGKPAAGYLPMAYPLLGSPGAWTGVGDPIVGGSYSKSTGAFSITGLRTGHYALSFILALGDQLSPSGDLLDLNNLNGTTGTNPVDAFSVTAGKTTAVSPSLQLPVLSDKTSAILNGQVTGGPATFAGRSMVSFMPTAAGSTYTTAAIKADGSFTVNLVPGTYTWSVDTEDGTSAPTTYEAEAGTITVAAGAVNDELDVTTRPEVPLAFTGSPEVTVSSPDGVDTVGTTFSAYAPTNHASTTDVTYQWLRNGHPIYGATASTYLARGVDAGTEITVRVAVQDYEGAGAYVAGVVVGIVGIGTIGNVAGDPQTVQPGTLTVDAASISPSPAAAFGRTLTARSEGWSQPNVAYSYVWMRDGIAILKATSATYKTTSLDVGHNITVVITGSKAGYGTAVTTSGTVQVLAAAAPKVTRAPTIKVTTSTTDPSPRYTVSTGSWSVKGLTFTYQFFADQASMGDPSPNNNIGGLYSGYDGKAITVVVTAHRTGYQDGSITVIARKGVNSTPNTAPTVQVGDADSILANGPVYVGEVLRAILPSSWNAPVSQTPTYTYKWERASGTPAVWKAISGATRSTYAPTISDVGHNLELITTVSSPYYAPIVDTAVAGLGTSGAPVNVGGAVTVTHSGSSIQPGTTLTGKLSGFPSGAKFTYQWKIFNLGSGIPIAGATKSTFVATSAQVGEDVYLVVTASYKGVTSTNSSTSFYPVDAATVLATITSPTIVGTKVVAATSPVGSTLTATAGTWNVSGAAYSYQWARDGISIPGATSSSYVPNGDALGDDITVIVTAKKNGLTTGSDESDAVTVTAGAAPRATTLPKISGTVKNLSMLSVTSGVWTLDGLTFQYQWLNNGVAIPGATGDTYVVDAAQLGAFTGISPTPVVKLSVIVTAVRNGYSNGGSTSLQTVAVPLITAN